MVTSPAANSAPRRPRNDKRRARNRAALVEAALSLVNERGSSGLTAAAIALRAGLHKQAFYAHFKHLDECLAALAKHLGREFEDAVIAQQLIGIVSAPERDREAERRAMLALIALATERRPVYALLLKERYGDGPLGQTMRKMIQRARRTCTQSLWVLAARVGVHGSHLHDVEALAHMALEIGLDTYDRILEDDSLDFEAEADRALRYVEAIIYSEFRRMIERSRELHGDGDGHAEQ
ncbi:MAG: TetR/AcrR family transcriptional regulator [Myxococcales bacterium]|nr:TetR/AcrR family transcriptional regulator [Myxococcales bacterium]